jgi:hypothetical protein
VRPVRLSRHHAAAGGAAGQQRPWHRAPDALLHIVATVGAAIMLALGLYIPLVAVSTVLKGSTWIFQTWNVLVFFYPVYFILSLGIGGALLFYGGKLSAWTSSRPPSP